MKNLGTPYAIGYILASLIILPLLIFGVNKLFFQGNDVEKYIYAYIEDSEEIKIFINNDDEVISNHERYTAFLSKKRGGKIQIRTKTFFTSNYNKYFQLRIANIPDNFYSALYNHIGKLGLIITVNKKDMENPQMGTKSNPVPVFKVVGDEKPIELSTQSVDGKSTIYDNWDIKDEEYENSVYVHLKYVMTKEEFKERFEKNK